jgi:hypothetical protein
MTREPRGATLLTAPLVKAPRSVSRHPDLNLLESLLHPLLELEKEPAMFGLVRDVYKDPDQVIAVRLAFAPPEAANRLRLGRHGPEPLFQFEQSLGDKIIRHGFAVIESERQQDLVAPE